MKLCLIKVAKSDACIRPLFANPVTYLDLYITEKHVLELFHPNVISSCVVHENFVQIKDHLHSIVYDSLTAALGGRNPSDLAMDISSRLKDLEDDLQCKHQKLDQKNILRITNNWLVT